MTVELDRRSDINPDAFLRVAWNGEAVALTAAARERIVAARRQFLTLLETCSDQHVYGVTTRVGPGASRVLGGEELAHQTQRRPRAAGVSFGEPLPERVVRGMLLSRLSNFVEGHSAVSLPLVEAVAAMLDGRPLPPVPALGNGGAGEVNALAHLFSAMTDDVDLEPKDNTALTNGSPCAGALVTDSAIAAGRRLELAHRVFALVAEGFKAPLEHYDPALGACWGNPHDAAALDAMAPYLEGAGADRRRYQAPVSFRIVPRVLGQVHQALEQARQVAAWSLPSITDNPTYLPPVPGDAAHPHGRLLHNGGFHNAAAAPAMDALAGAWADLVLLAGRLTARTLDGKSSQMPDGLRGRATDDTVRYLPGAQVAFAEQAKRAAQRNLLPAGGEGMADGQSDVGVPTFAAWRAERECGDLAVSAMAVLAVTAAQALDVTERAPTPALAELHATVREAVPAIDAPRLLGPDLARLTETFQRALFDPAQASAS